MKDVFSQIYQDNYWKSDESVSGHGSTKEATNAIRSALPLLFERYGIETIVDIPCGDLNWFKDLVDTGKYSYFGMDIVPQIIEQNRAKFGHFANTFFEVRDITRDPLPPADLIFCRDLLGHFSNADVKKALVNVKNSRARYFMATTFPLHENSGDIKTGEWRPLNLEKLWGLPAPIEVINEKCTAGGGAFTDKSLALWDLRDVR